MVTRVTTRSLTNNALANIFRLTKKMEQAQLRIATGKRINKLSDGGERIKSILNFRSDMSQADQFVRNINQGKLLLNVADSALSDITLQLNRAREIAVSQANAVATASTRGFNAIEIDNIISQVVSDGNIRIQNKFIFSGQNVLTAPFTASASGAVYLGDKNQLSMQIDKNSNIGVSIIGSEILGSDLDPGIDGNTSISDLTKGNGISLGSFSITDREGNNASVTITAGMTINQVINAINSSLSNITASINSSNSGILISDSSSNPSQNLVISDTGSGKTAFDLGIIGNVDGNITGLDLDARMANSTPLSLMNSGQGLTLSSIAITNGTASGTVSFTSASSIGDVINSINSSGLNVTATINSAGNGLVVKSNSSSSTAVVSEVGTGSSAADLGIMGGNNILETLLALKEALEKNDAIGIAASLDNLESGLERISAARGRVGARVRRLESTQSIHEQRNVDNIESLSNIEDADFIKEEVDFLAFQNAFNATLNVTARIIQASLIDFLR